jgi:hypothetical protein
LELAVCTLLPWVLMEKETQDVAVFKHRP